MAAGEITLWRGPADEPGAPLTRRLAVWRGYPESDGPHFTPGTALSRRERLLNALARWDVRLHYTLTHMATRPAAWRQHVLDTLDQQRIEREDAQRATRAQRIEHRLESELRREVRRSAKRIQLRLTQLEFAHWYTGKRAGKISTIRFAQAAATPAAVYLRVDTARLPRGRGVTSEAIQDPVILNELSLAAGAPVTAFQHYERGLWLIVERAGGLAAIPHYVEYMEALSEMPVSAGPLDIPLGFGANRRFYHADIAEMPHLLIAGATGFGKSVMLHGILCTLIQRAAPSRLSLVLVDLKGGTELGVYCDVPHLWDQRKSPTAEVELSDEEEVTPRLRKRRAEFVLEPRIYGRREDVVLVLDRVYFEVERRLQLFQSKRVRDIAGWNHHQPMKLPHLVVVIDEIANVMLDPKERPEVERRLADIAARGRAPGVHLIIATQRPSVDVVTGLIKANFPARIAFTTSSQVDSRVILDRSDAAGLGIPGRLIYQQENRRYVCQAAFVSEALVDDIVQRVCTGAGSIAAQVHSVGRMDMIRWALDNNEGRFSIDAVYNQFRGRGVTHADVRAIWAELPSAGMMEVDGKFLSFSERLGRFVPVGDDGKAATAGVAFDEIARWAISENGGKLTRDGVFAAFSGRLSKHQATRMLREISLETIVIDEVEYTFQRPRNPSKPMTLTPVGDARCSTPNM